MSKEIKEIMAKAKKEKRQLTPEEVAKIKQLEAQKETATAKQNTENNNKQQTTSKPTTSKPTTSKPTTSKPTTSKSTTSKSTTSKSTTSKSTTSKPTTSKPTTNKQKTKIKFLHSPSCEPFNLAYHTGEEVVLPTPLAAELIDLKFAEEVKTK